MWLMYRLVLVAWLWSAYALAAKTKPPLVQLPASDAQMDYLAQTVCLDLQINLGNVSPRCVENLKNEPDKRLPAPPRIGFRLRCRSDTSMTFELKPLKHRILIVAVPDPPDFDVILNYRIVEPNTTIAKVDSSPEAQTVFIALLNHRGRRSPWRVDTKLGMWTPPPHQDYGVDVQFQNTSTNHTVDAVISWNRTEETDSCFYFMAWCEKGGKVANDITPEQKPRVEFKNITQGDSCNARVIGKYGETTAIFETPTHKRSDDNNDNTRVPIKEKSKKIINKAKVKRIVTLFDTTDAFNRSDDDSPRILIEDKEAVDRTSPRNISSRAISLEDEGWTLRVNWSRPQLSPDFFNVTIFAEDTVSLIVPGNESEVTFSHIKGNHTYFVGISSVLGKKAAHTSRGFFFPGVAVGRARLWVWAGAAGGAWAGAALTAAAAAFAALRRRRRRPPPVKPQPTIVEVKPLDETLIESVGDSSIPDGWEIKSERVLLHEVIGEGAFGVVRRGTLTPTGKEVAVKMLKEFPSAEEKRAFQAEMEVMKSVGAHPHVVSLVGCCRGRTPLIVAEYCSRGDLLSFLRRSWDVLISKRHTKYYNNNIETSNYRNDLFKCKMPQEQSRLVINRLYDLQENGDIELTALDLLSFCRQIAMGMEFLAANRLVHRDLAARNVLVTRDKMLKIADFGLSRDVYEENQYKQKGNGKMPVKWMALESLTRRIYTTQSDVWSFGVVMWEIVTVGASPYPEVPAARLPRLLRAGYRMPRPDNCSAMLYELMQSCWRARPRERPTFPELHARLDELLNSASAHQYLTLELDDSPAPARRRYFKMILRAKRYWTRAESYERPLRACSNHYTNPPVPMNKTSINV